MKIKIVEERIDYDGLQIHSLWAYRTFGLQGDSIVAVPLADAVAELKTVPPEWFEVAKAFFG